MKMNKWLWMLAAWGACFLLSKLGVGAATAGLYLIPIVAGLMLFYSWSAERTAADNKTAEDFKKGFEFSHLGDSTGVAIDRARRIVRLRGVFEGVASTKDYAFDQVREFEKIVLKGGHLMGSPGIAHNMQGAVNASMAGLGQAAQNKRITRENSAGSGIFFTVKDIDRPKWRVAFQTEAQMDKWMEILRQSMVD